MIFLVVEVAGAVIFVEFEAKLGGRPPSSFLVPIVPNDQAEFVAVEFERGATASARDPRFVAISQRTPGWNWALGSHASISRRHWTITGKAAPN